MDRSSSATGTTAPSRSAARPPSSVAWARVPVEVEGVPVATVWAGAPLAPLWHEPCGSSPAVSCSPPSWGTSCSSSRSGRSPGRGANRRAARRAPGRAPGRGAPPHRPRAPRRRGSGAHRCPAPAARAPQARARGRGRGPGRAPPRRGAGGGTAIHLGAHPCSAGHAGLPRRGPEALRELLAGDGGGHLARGSRGAAGAPAADGRRAVPHRPGGPPQHRPPRRGCAGVGPGEPPARGAVTRVRRRRSRLSRPGQLPVHPGARRRAGRRGGLARAGRSHLRVSIPLGGAAA